MCSTGCSLLTHLDNFSKILYVRTMKRTILFVVLALCILSWSRPLRPASPEKKKHLLIVYYSQTQRTRLMAEAVAEGARSVNGVRVKLLDVKKAKVSDALDADGVIIGSPVYNANVAPAMQEYINSWPFEGGPMRDKLGAAFVTGGGISAGEELVQMNILQSLLVHGMLVVGGSNWKSSFGASAITEEAPFLPSKTQPVQPRFLKKAKALGKRVARLLSTR